jgi:aldehyde:ferredoxin oxidoreductase
MGAGRQRPGTRSDHRAKQLHGCAWDELGLDLDLELAFQGRNPKEKGKLLRWFTISRAVVESLPGCVFLVRDTLGLDMRPWWKLFRAASGVEMSYAEFLTSGERLMNLDRAFNIREGYRRADDKPPYRMMYEDVPGFGYPRLEPVFDGMLDEYYHANGWSLSTSIPTAKKLHELDMDYVLIDFQKLGVEVE